MELHTAPQVKHIRDRIGHLPFFSQVAVGDPMRVEFDQTAEEQTVNSLGLSISPNSRIQISRHRFNQKIDDAGLGGDGMRAGGERKKKEKGSKGD